MKYNEMIQKARTNGISSDKIMNEGIESIDNLLCIIEKERPNIYWKFMREQHGILYKNHYTEDFAKYDVSCISYTDKEERKREGAHWTIDQIEELTKNMAFPVGTTKWDKYVAFNSMYADLCKVLDDQAIIKSAHAFYFMDEDAPAGKIWLYIKSMK